MKIQSESVFQYNLAATQETKIIDLLSYRQAVRTDIPQMARIWSEEASEGGTSEERMTAYFDRRHHPQHALLPRVIYIALENDRLIGYIAGHRTRRYACDGELQWVYVAPVHRRRGVATELLRRLAAWFVQEQVLRVCVNVASDTLARNFYMHRAAQPLNSHWLVWNRIAMVLDDGKSSSRTVATGLE